MNIHQAWIDYHKSDKSMRFGQYLYSVHDLWLRHNGWFSVYEIDDNYCYTKVIEMINKQGETNE